MSFVTRKVHFERNIIEQHQITWAWDFLFRVLLLVNVLHYTSIPIICFFFFFENSISKWFTENENVNYFML